jgi:ribonuclease I
MPPNQQHGRQADAENGPTPEFCVLLSWEFGFCGTEHQGLGTYPQFCSMQPKNDKKSRWIEKSGRVAKQIQLS